MVITLSIRIIRLCRVLPHLGPFTHLNIFTRVTGLYSLSVCYTAGTYQIRPPHTALERTERHFVWQMRSSCLNRNSNHREQPSPWYGLGTGSPVSRHCALTPVLIAASCPLVLPLVRRKEYTHLHEITTSKLLCCSISDAQIMVAMKVA